jgi:hypothetical protein
MNMHFTQVDNFVIREMDSQLFPPGNSPVWLNLEFLKVDMR